MISKELYKEISSQWKERVYQKYERLETRYPMFLKYINVFKDKHVLEIGANAGMAAMQIATVAKQYTGVELALGYYQQSLITKKYIKNPNVTFNNCSVKTYIKRMLAGRFNDKPNAAYLSYVLYHFEDREVEMFKEHILPLLDVIIVQSRFAKRNIKGRTKHNSYSFWHPDNVIKYLLDAGFQTTLVWHENKKFHFIIGTKDKPMALPKVDVPKDVADNIFTADKLPKVPITKTMKGLQDVNTGEGGVHPEGESASTERRSTPERIRRTVEGESFGDVEREITPEGQGGDVLPEERENGSEDILQPVVEESATPEVREADIPEVVKVVRPRSRAKARKNSVSENKPDVQGEEA